MLVYWRVISDQCGISRPKRGKRHCMLLQATRWILTLMALGQEKSCGAIHEVAAVQWLDTQIWINFAIKYLMVTKHLLKNHGYLGNDGELCQIGMSLIWINIFRHFFWKLFRVNIIINHNIKSVDSWCQDLFHQFSIFCGFH